MAKSRARARGSDGLYGLFAVGLGDGILEDDDEEDVDGPFAFVILFVNFNIVFQALLNCLSSSVLMIPPEEEEDADEAPLSTARGKTALKILPPFVKDKSPVKISRKPITSNTWPHHIIFSEELNGNNGFFPRLLPMLQLIFPRATFFNGF